MIDAHGHAGHGEALSAPWSTYNDPEVILRHAEEAGIDKTIIFPIENSTYQKANEEIARIVERYPGKFVGFAKHDPIAEAGKIERLLTREVKRPALVLPEVFDRFSRDNGIIDTVRVQVAS